MNKMPIIKIIFVWLVTSTCFAMEAETTPQGYVDQEVQFATRDKNNKQILLSGTLTRHKGGKNHPAVIFISGAGPYSRKDEQEPFRELARQFANLGVASLYFDKRGNGKSEGTYITTMTLDYAKDVENAIDYLKTVKDIDPDKIGLFGHSEGGLIATMMGAWRTDLAFIMLYGAPAIRLDDLNRARKKFQVESAIKSGMPKEEGEAILKMFEALDNQVLRRQELNESESLILAEQVLMKAGLDAGLSEKMAKSFTAGFLEELKHITSITWFREVSKINPIRYFELITPTIPVLVVNGEADDVVRHELNIPKIREALAKSRNPDVEIVTLPNILHHYNNVAQGHRPGIAKELLQVFTSWLEKRMSSKK